MPGWVGEEPNIVHEEIEETSQYLDKIAISELDSVDVEDEKAGPFYDSQNLDDEKKSCGAAAVLTVKKPLSCRPRHHRA